ncbi:MAG TPA: hypothetical protein VFW44_07030 [Bryobacteraceae bacterium]|nr:hypothetical protein [Bryobacteraceae bacterium]
MTRLVLMLLICGVIAFAQSDQTETNMSCVERLQLPRYPALAYEAGISGQVTATVAIPSSGPSHVESNGPKLLAPYVEDAIKASVFRQTCAGKSVRLVFNFDFDEDPTKGIAFGYPNQFFIKVPHARLQVN